MIETTESYSITQPPGSIGRVWGVAGATEFDSTLCTARITVEHNLQATHDIRQATLMHERGHRDTAQDLVDGLGSDAVELLFGADADRWDIEVDAWVRALENGIPDLDGFHFIMDCLNSYRRALPASDEQWDALKDLLVTFYEGEPPDILDYVPLEPDPNEAPPTCGIPLPQTDDEQGEQGDDIGNGDDDDGDDEQQSGGEPQQQGEGGDGADSDPIPLPDGTDGRWLSQEVLDELVVKSVDEVAADRGLSVTNAPPLIQAMR